MKKILLMSAFALFGTFAMANESLEQTLDGGGTLTIYTTIYGCNGEKIGTTKSTMDCSTCEGATILVLSSTYCDPTVDSFPEPER